MKVFIESENFDPNSNEMKKLYIKDMYLGDYSYGTYSKLQLALIECESIEESELSVITGMNSYVNGIMYCILGIDAWDYNSPEEIRSLIFKKTGKNFNDWLNDVLEEKIKEATTELTRYK